MRMKNGKMLLERIVDNKEHDGIIYTDDEKNKSFKGKVVAIDDENNGYEIGDIVMFSEFSGEDVWIEGKSYLIIDHEDVWGIL
jgi:chaperonin GroES